MNQFSELISYIQISKQFNQFFILLFLWVQYHGGTNFGRTAGGPFIATSYDYDAPLDEYGTCAWPTLKVVSISILKLLSQHSWQRDFRIISLGSASLHWIQILACHQSQCAMLDCCYVMGGVGQSNACLICFQWNDNCTLSYYSVMLCGWWALLYLDLSFNGDYREL